MSNQPAGHLYGPPPVHIIFSYGDRNLAEVRGHPMEMDKAYAAAERSIRVLAPGPDQGPQLHMLSLATVTVVCGDRWMSLDEYLKSHREASRMAFLLCLKGYSPAPVVGNPKYVMTVVLTEDGQHAIGLIKRKGPEKLIGKITFPGGRRDPGEDPRTAAARELEEETGVRIPADRMVNIANSEQMAVYAARSNDVFKAFTREEEEVLILAVPRHLEYRRQLPDAYVPEFEVFLKAAAAALPV